MCYFKKKYENAVVDYETTVAEKNKLEQQCKKQKEVIEEVRDRITIKLGRYINEKDYVIDDVALDELLQILDKVKDNVDLKDILKKEDN